MRRVLVATRSPHKLAELRQLLDLPGVELVALDDLDIPGDPIEDGATFADNALIKARWGIERSGLPTLADDSGIEVEALGGGPGVRTRRYAGEDASDEENNAKLMAELAALGAHSPEARRARYVCVLACLRPDRPDEPLLAEGTFAGRIATVPRGSGGFGYDPIFEPDFEPPGGRTVGQMTQAEKNAVSHRARAAIALRQTTRHPWRRGLVRVTASVAPSGRSVVALAGRVLGRPWLAYLGLALIAFPILEMLVVGDRAIQYAHDIFDDNVPRLFSIAADWRAFGPSLWDPHLTSGNALLSQFSFPPLAPDVLLSFVLPPFAAFLLNTIGIVWLAGLGMHLFLRDSMRLPAAASYAGGVLAALAFWHYILGYAVPLLPLLLWTSDRIFVPGAERRRRTAAAALLVAFLFYSSGVQVVVLVGVVAGAYLVFTGDDRRSRLDRAATFALVWLAGALLAAPVLATLLMTLGDSHRAIWDLAYLYGSFSEAVVAAVRLYGGVLLGTPIAGIGGSADIYGSYFVGAVALPLLAISLAIPRPDSRARFFLALLVIIPLIDLAGSALLPVIDQLGPLRTFQWVRVRHFMAVVLAINVALGLAWLLAPGAVARISRRRRTIMAGLVIGSFVVLGVEAIRAVVVARRGPEPAIAQAGAILVAVALVGGLVVALVVSALVWRSLRRAGWQIERVLSVGLVFVLLLALASERVVWSRAERYADEAHRSAPQLASWADRLGPSDAQAFIAAQPGEGRVVSVGEHANRTLVAGLDAADGYQVVYPLRYHRLFRLLIAPHLALDPAKAAYYDGWGNRAYAFGPELSRPIADLLGIRWLYAVGSAAPIDWQAVDRDGAVTIYENADAFPRAFVVHEAAIEASDPALDAAVGAATSERLRATAFLISGDATGLALPGGGPDADDRATVSHSTPDAVEIQTSTTRPGLLIVADTFAPGWEATVDGSPAAIRPVDIALRGIDLPAGEHVVTVRYRPLPTYAGFGIALLTGLGLLAWVVLGRRRRGADGGEVHGGT